MYIFLVPPFVGISIPSEGTFTSWSCRLAWSIYPLSNLQAFSTPWHLLCVPFWGGDPIVHLHIQVLILPWGSMQFDLSSGGHSLKFLLHIPSSLHKWLFQDIWFYQLVESPICIMCKTCSMVIYIDWFSPLAILRDWILFFICLVIPWVCLGFFEVILILNCFYVPRLCSCTL